MSLVQHSEDLPDQQKLAEERKEKELQINTQKGPIDREYTTFTSENGYANISIEDIIRGVIGHIPENYD